MIFTTFCKAIASGYTVPLQAANEINKDSPACLWQKQAIIRSESYLEWDIWGQTGRALQKATELSLPLEAARLSACTRLFLKITTQSITPRYRAYTNTKRIATNLGFETTTLTHGNFMYFRHYVVSILFVICACVEAHLSHKVGSFAREQYKYTVHQCTSVRSGRLRVIILEFMNHPSSTNLTSFFAKFWHPDCFRRTYLFLQF